MRISRRILDSRISRVWCLLVTGYVTLVVTYSLSRVDKVNDRVKSLFIDTDDCDLTSRTGQTGQIADLVRILNCAELDKFEDDLFPCGHTVSKAASSSERLLDSVSCLQRTFETFVNKSSTFLGCTESASRGSTINDEATIRDGKIAIAVVAALKDSTVVNLSLENKKRYAQKHGYDVIAIDELGSFSRKPAWAKIPLLFSLLNSGEYDYVWSLDLDTVILRDIPLTDIITPGYDIIIAQDSMGLNTGSFVLRAKSAWSRLLLVFTWQQRYYRGSLYYWEQTPLNCLYRQSRGVQGHVHVAAKRLINAYERDWNVNPDGLLMDFEEGQGPFVLHFPGDRDRWKKLKAYYQRYG